MKFIDVLIYAVIFLKGNIPYTVPSGKHAINYGKIHHFSWVNPLFLSPFSIAFSIFTRPGMSFLDDIPAMGWSLNIDGNKTLSENRWRKKNQFPVEWRNKSSHQQKPAHSSSKQLLQGVLQELERLFHARGLENFFGSNGILAQQSRMS